MKAYENIMATQPYKKHYSFEETGCISLNLQCKRLPYNDEFCAHVFPDSTIEIVNNGRYFAKGIYLCSGIIETSRHIDTFKIIPW